jgi:hypothetical protein
MIRNLVLVACLSLFVVRPSRADEPAAVETAAAKEYAALVEQFEQLGRSPELIDRFFALAKSYPQDPVAIDALSWVVVHVRDGKKPAEAADILAAEHIASENLADVCLQLAESPSLAGERLLRLILEKSPHPEVQARACFYLAGLLQQQLRLHETLTAEPTSRRRFDQFYGKEFVKHLLGRSAAEISAEAEQLYDRVLQDYSSSDNGMTELARVQLVELRHLTVGKPALEIEGEDIDGTPFKLSDYRGKVVMLSFWGHW